MNQAHFDDYQFATESLPIRVEYAGLGEFRTNGIGFNEYYRMQTHTRKLSKMRRLETPSWALNDSLLRKVLVHYLESRAFSRKACAEINKTFGADAALARESLDLRKVEDRLQYEKIETRFWLQRLQKAEAKLVRRRPQLSAKMDRMCAEYVRAKNAGDVKRCEQLQNIIRGMDTQLRTTVAHVIGMCTKYYRLGMDSFQIAEELELRSPQVRQVLRRLNLVAKQLFGEQPTELPKNQLDKNYKPYQTRPPQFRPCAHRGFHIHWHVRRKIFSPVCQFCIEEHRLGSR